MDFFCNEPYNGAILFIRISPRLRGRVHPGAPQLSAYAFLNPRCKYPLPASFDFSGYIEAEQELWALFPETDGKRVNFCQVGLTAGLYVEVADDGSELKAGETYFLMPGPHRGMR